MALVTLTSDFGLKDYYAAALKAALLSSCPLQNMVDISHEVSSCNIAEAAFTLRSVYQDFPLGTIHLVAVGSAMTQQHVLAFHKGHFFIGPDNGILSLVFNGQQPEMLLSLNTADMPGQTFPAKHIYAPIVCLLLDDEAPESLGSPLDQLQQRIELTPRLEADRIKGHVIHVDHYGNLISNISREDFEKVHANRKYRITFEYERHTRVDENYHSRDFGDCVAFFNSNNLLEIAINQGNASELLGMKRESPVTIEFKN
ncbi:SAM-dependent chlorinase/fluorinase [Flammeovirgaceae bacterium SG7u.111]|nr:SAM-dependent chlorinase/fluorinase [Flammeovirgaceae bacterium SG7u.132]WPO36799.1 SAM-dependent chlorinase/fluorinase [Flammeovirgaceae bacterium SG7u.111]